MCLQSMGVRLSRAELDEVRNRMDKLRNGTIYYGDMLEQVRSAKTRVSSTQQPPGTATSAAAPVSRSNSGMIAETTNA